MRRTGPGAWPRSPCDIRALLKSAAASSPRELLAGLDVGWVGTGHARQSQPGETAGVRLWSPRFAWFCHQLIARTLLHTRPEGQEVL